MRERIDQSAYRRAGPLTQSAKGACGIADCVDGFQDCNQSPADGCEGDLQNDPARCGSCTTDCSSLGPGNWTCVAGACVPSLCPQEKGDCNGLATDGCETDLFTSPQHCGFCNNACDATGAITTCSNGTCKITGCTAGRDDCDGVYDLGSVNGRVLLRLKGQISELELHKIRNRLHAALVQKAERGELAQTLPAGLVRDAHGCLLRGSI